VTDILSRIDDTLTFHSAGLGVDLQVPVEREPEDGEWAPFTTTGGGSSGEYRRVGTAIEWRIVLSLPRFKTAAERKADAARRARLRRMHHLYRMRRVR